MLLLLFQLAVAAPPPTRFELPNGLRVWVQEDHRRPVVLVQVTYKVGSLDEQPGQTGVAHYVEHMVYRATEHVRNEDVYGYIDRIGGRYTGGTWPEFTRYAETVPAWAAESAIRVTADRMCCALFDSTEFERERHNVVTEANGFSDTDPLNTMRDAVMYAAFDVHPYRLNSNTWARDNLVLTRDQAFDWYKRHYGPNNAVLAVVGDITATEARRLVERYFSSIPRAPETGEITVVEPPQRAEKRVTVTAPAARPELDVVYHAPSAHHPDFPAFDVATRLLRGRLAGLHGTVTVSDSASQYPHVLGVVVDGDSTGDLDRALAALDAAIEDLSAGRVQAGELASARSRATAADSVRQASASALPPRRSRLTHVADELSDREPLPWEVTQADLDRIRAAEARVAASDIATVAARWLRRSQRTVGMLRPGPDDFVATWSDGRRLAGERMEIPPLTTPPAKRRLPEPVPAPSLEPLAPIGITTAVRRLPNNVVVRVARVRDAAPAPYVRLECDCTDTTVLSAAERALRAEPRLAGATVRVVRGTTLRDSSAEGIAREWALGRVGGRSGTLMVGIVSGAEPGNFATAAATALRGLRRQAERSLEVERGSGDTLMRKSDERQVSIAMALPGVPRGHPDQRALELLNYIVGVPSYGGRLGWALTKSGLTYAAATTTTFGAHGGSILLSTDCDTRNTAATLQAMREVVEGVGARGVEAWELREAQAFTLGRTLLYGAREDSDADAIAAALIQSERTGSELLDLPALSRSYLGVTIEDLNRVAKKYYRPELLRVAAVGAVPDTLERIFPPGTFRTLFEP